MLGFSTIGGAPVAYDSQRAFVESAPVAVFAEFPAAYEILRDAAIAVFAEFPASYQIISDLVMAYIASKARTLKVKTTGLAFEKPAGDSFWNLQDPKKPQCIVDPSETLDITLDWNEVLTDITDTISSHTIVVDSKIRNEGSAAIDGKTTVFLAVVTGSISGKYPVTFRITTASSPARVFDRTVYIVIEDR